MAEAWPSALFPRGISFDLEHVSRGGGVSTNGSEQFVGSGSGRWVASYSEVPVATEEAILAWRGLRARVRGRAGTILVPAFDWFQPWPRDEQQHLLSPENVRRSRLDGTQFADPAVPAQSAIVASMGAAAARRATTISIAMSQGSAPRAGHYFSLGNRLHIVTEPLGGGLCRIEPPLRAPAAQGAPINFSAPVCEMRLADDGAGRLDLELGRWGFVSPSFVEAV